MVKGLEAIASREYPGRVILMGCTEKGGNPVAAYAVTGRSPSSRARKIIREEDTLWVKPTHTDLIRQGNIDLLVYPCLIVLPGGVAVSNGKQTVDVMACLGLGESGLEVLAAALKDWDYEPDAPAYTPRIAGCLLPNRSAALGLIRRAEDGSSLRSLHGFIPKPGYGKAVMTYQGDPGDPLPSFTGEPVECAIPGGTARETAEALYEALAPAPGRDDFRVAVASILYGGPENAAADIHIINACERKKT